MFTRQLVIYNKEHLAEYVKQLSEYLQGTRKMKPKELYFTCWICSNSVWSRRADRCNMCCEQCRDKWNKRKAGFARYYKDSKNRKEYLKQWDKAHRTERSAYHRERYNNDPEFRERRKQHVRRYNRKKRERKHLQQCIFAHP